VSGDAARGEALFQGKGDCLSCHRVGPEGGFSGPDLGTVGSQRSLEHLKTSMLDPNDDVRRRYWLATVTGADGARTLGNILNEDRHSLQLLDLRGQLRSFDKATLQTIERDPNSMMQSYDGVFDEREMDDVLSYLVSLRRGRTP
jgi:putative heme-binding domain-containing protein